VPPAVTVSVRGLAPATLQFAERSESPTTRSPASISRIVAVSLVPSARPALPSMLQTYPSGSRSVPVVDVVTRSEPVAGPVVSSPQPASRSGAISVLRGRSVLRRIASSVPGPPCLRALASVHTTPLCRSVDGKANDQHGAICKTLPGRALAASSVAGRCRLSMRCADKGKGSPRCPPMAEYMVVTGRHTAPSVRPVRSSRQMTRHQSRSPTSPSAVARITSVEAREPELPPLPMMMGWVSCGVPFPWL
jgi:hypothetical protein